MPKNEIGTADNRAKASLKPNKRLLPEKVKENASVKTPIAIRMCIISILLKFPGFPVSRVPLGIYIYSLGDKS